LEKEKNLPHEKIEIILINKENQTVEGISNESTPYEIGKKHLKNSFLKECLVTKILCSRKTTETKNFKCRRRRNGKEK
jgi:hypothetical protein